MTFYKTKTMIKDDMKLYLSLSSPLETEIRSLSPHLAWMIPTVLPMNSVAIFYEFHIRTCNLIRSGCADNRWKEKSKKWSLGIKVLEYCAHFSALWGKWERLLKIRTLKKTKGWLLSSCVAGRKSDLETSKQKDSSRVESSQGWGSVALDSLHYNNRLSYLEAFTSQQKVWHWINFCGLRG